MINELATAMGIEPVMIYIVIALIMIAVVYSYNEKIGLVLGGLAILGILTNDWKTKKSVDISDLVK